MIRPREVYRVQQPNFIYEWSVEVSPRFVEIKRDRFGEPVYWRLTSAQWRELVQAVEQGLTISSQ